MSKLEDNGFLTFLLACRTFDPEHDEPRPFPSWPVVRKVAKALDTGNRLLVVKSRQMMITWIGCAYMLYRAMSSGPGVHLVLSKEERSARELIFRIRFLYEGLPEEISAAAARFQAGTVHFPALGARIISLPAAPYAVRGLSPRTVFWDEMAFTPMDEEIWASVKPAVDAGGKFLGVSTPNGPGGVFSRLVHGREEGFRVHRVHFREHPERGKLWEKRARAGLSDARWRREQELSFEGAEGCVYDQFEEAVHLLDEPHQPGRDGPPRIYRGIDFGYRRPAAVWMEQLPDDTLVVFDCIVGDKWPIDQFVREIRNVDAKHGISEKDVIWTAVDPAGAAKTDEGISPVEHLQAAHFKLVWGSSSIAAGIEVVRSLLRDASGNVRLRVDRRCVRLVEAFHGYAWGPDGELPVKDGVHDHPLDALRYLAVNLRRSRNQLPVPSPRIRGLPPPPRSAPL